MATPSPTKLLSTSRRASLFLAAIAAFLLLFLLLVLSTDPDAVYDLHLAFAVAITTILFAPLDRTQVILQTQDARPRTLSKECPIRYAGPFDCMARVLREQGVTGLWRGNTANTLKRTVTALVSGSAITLATKALVRLQRVPLGHEPGPAAVQLAEGLGYGFAAIAWTVALYPLEFAHTRLAVDSGKIGREYTGVLDCLQKTCTREGLAAMYIGVYVALQELLAFQVTHFLLVASTSRFLDSRLGLKVLDKISYVASVLIPLSHLAASCIAGAVGYPFETVRRRLIWQSGADERQYTDVRDCWKSTLREEGATGFYKGAVVKAVLTGSCVLVSSVLLDWISVQPFAVLGIASAVDDEIIL